jgi:hypothetical protein
MANGCGRSLPNARAAIPNARPFVGYPTDGDVSCELEQCGLRSLYLKPLARRDALASTLQFIRNNADNLEKCLYLDAGSIAEPSPNEKIQDPSPAGGTFDCARGWWREEETAK